MTEILASQLAFACIVLCLFRSLTFFHRYTVSLSGALALLNMVPCYSLDGQWTLMAFIDYLLPPLIQNKVTRTILYHVVLLTGTILLLANIIFALWTLSRSWNTNAVKRFLPVDIKLPDTSFKVIHFYAGSYDIGIPSSENCLTCFYSPTKVNWSNLLGLYFEIFLLVADL